ncbi:MAG: T9SS type A sorting domain-containing protein [Ignavibacteriales bacterium]|nr:T9SS type A sorting domain-containing protein [Ignavibacteriales bacterium]
MFRVTLKGSLKMALLVTLLFTKAFSQNFVYTQNFETINPFKFWTSNATYTINFFGPSSDRFVDGTKSLKMDITINGNGTNDCYYYWTLPVSVNLHGKMDFSVYLWMDSPTAQLVKLGYDYDFPPTGLTRIPGAPAVTQFNTWFNQKISLSDDIIYHADYFAHNKIYGSTYDDFGRQLGFIPLMIKAKGSHRLVFYIDKLELKGTVLDQTTFPLQYTAWWAAFQTKLLGIVTLKHTERLALPPIPNITGLTLTSKGQAYYNSLQKANTDINNLFGMMDGKPYFAPTVMDSLEELIGLWPSWVQLLNVEINNQAAKLVPFSINPTQYNRLTGTNIPGDIISNPKFTARVCASEYEPFSLFLQARAAVNNIKVQWTSLTGSGGTIPASALDAFIAKVWYQNGYDINGRTGKWLTQELLIKNDALILVDETAKTNSLLVQRTDGTTYYINISGTSTSIPTNVKIKDAAVLQPFSLTADRNKQLWFTLHVPANTAPGKYTGNITITADVIGTVTTIPVEIEVLSFKLNPSRLSYSLYYHGYVDDANWQKDPFTSFAKSSNQYKIEMTDMKEHGVLYPTTYQSLNNIGADLTIRNQVGLPKDRLFVTGFETGNPSTTAALTTLKNSVTSWKNKIAQYGYSNLYVYGIDEAVGDVLLSERPAWQAVHDAGAKVFAAGYYKHYDVVGDLLDCANIQPDPRKEQADLYHSSGKKIYDYHNPMAGVEDPEVYRRNYGFLLWKNNYDGVMNYAYQRNYGHIWNDFDPEPTQPHPYRDHVYSYPISDGVISTVQWEGFREAVDDIRYVSTLQDKIDSLKNLGRDVSSFQQFANSIDPTQDLNSTRYAIIDKINLLLGSGGITDNIPPAIVSVVALTPNNVTIKFSEKVRTTEVPVLSNYTINNGITVTNALLNSARDEVTLTTSSLTANKTYALIVSNIKDDAGNVISANSTNFQFQQQQQATAKDITLLAEKGIPANGTTLKYKTGSAGLKVAYCTSTSSTVAFTVNIPSAGNWYVWGRFFWETATTTGPNSFFISVDNGTKLKFGNNDVNLNKWYWGGDGSTSTGTPKILSLGNLTVGQHTITVFGDEVGATNMLDEILLSTNPNSHPTDDKITLTAENGTLTNGAALKTQTGSLGTKVAYCAATTSSISFDVRFLQTANYYVWGRFYFAGTGTDPNCFYLSIDGGIKRLFGNNKDNFNKWHWGGNGNVETGPLTAISIGNFGAGSHTVTISGFEFGPNVMVDMVLVTSDPNYIPTDADFIGNTIATPNGDTFLLTAETGTLANGSALKTQIGSIGTKVAYCTSTTSTISFNVKFLQLANYYVWGRFYFAGTGTDPNSFYFSVDGGFKRKFGNNKDNYNKWHWGGNGNVETGPITSLAIGSFGAGQHTITVSGLEFGPNVMVDMVLITTDPDYVPTDAGIALLKRGNEQNEITEIPTEFELSQNYPNPFNPTTKIKYAIPYDSHLTLKVFDILGREVATLVNEKKVAGFYEANFDASKLSSGIYIYQIKTNDMVVSKKMMLVK